MQRILVFRSGALGDFLLTVPILAALRKAHVHSSITLMTRSAYGEFLVERSLVDEFRNMESADWAGLFSDHPSLPPGAGEWLSSFAKVFVWMTDADGCFFRNLRKFCRAEIHRMNPIVNPAGIHATDQLAGVLPQANEFVFYSHQSVSSRALALHFGSGSKSKNWPIAHWKSFLNILASMHPGLPLLIISGEADACERAALLPTVQCLPNPITMADNWRLARLARQLSECAAYVGHDTGVSHLAALCSVPSLWLFGPTDPFVWAPRRPNVHPVQSDLENLEPMDVWARVQLLMATPTSRRSGL